MKVIKYIYTSVETTFQCEELSSIASRFGHNQLACSINKFFKGSPSVVFIAMLGKERIWLDSAYRIGSTGPESQKVPFDVFRILFYHMAKTLPARQ